MGRVFWRVGHLTTLTRNPFSAFLDVASIPDELQDEFLDLRNDSLARNLFNEKLIKQFR